MCEFNDSIDYSLTKITVIIKLIKNYISSNILMCHLSYYVKKYITSISYYNN